MKEMLKRGRSFCLQTVVIHIFCINIPAWDSGCLLMCSEYDWDLTDWFVIRYS